MHNINILNREVVALNQKVASQDGVIGRLKAQVNAVEEENQDLREAVDGVGAAAPFDIE